MAKQKYPCTWADEFYGQLMQQAVTEENTSYAASGVGAWLGEKAATMPKDEFEALLEKAVEELENYAWEYWLQQQQEDA